MPPRANAAPATRRATLPDAVGSMWSIRDLQGSSLADPLVWQVPFRGPVVPFASNTKVSWAQLPGRAAVRKGVYDWLTPADLTVWINKWPLLVVEPGEGGVRFTFLSPGRNGWAGAWRHLRITVPEHEAFLLPVPSSSAPTSVVTPYDCRFVLGTGEDDGPLPEVTIQRPERGWSNNTLDAQLHRLATAEVTLEDVEKAAFLPGGCRALAQNLTLPEDGFRMLRGCFDTRALETLVQNPSLPDPFYPWAARFLPRAFAQNPALPLYALNDPELRSLGLPLNSAIYRHLRHGEPLTE